MNRCFIMFACFILTLLLAVLTDDTHEVVDNEKLIMERKPTAVIRLTDEIISDDILKN